MFGKVEQAIWKLWQKPAKPKKIRQRALYEPCGFGIIAILPYADALTLVITYDVEDAFAGSGHAALPQLDRGPDYESGRQGFESLTPHQTGRPIKNRPAGLRSTSGIRTREIQQSSGLLEEQRACERDEYRMSNTRYI